MNRNCVTSRAGWDNAGPARLLKLAGVAALVAAAPPALGQQSNQPGESDLYHRSSEQGGRAAIQDTSFMRQREGAYAPDAWRDAWDKPAKSDTTVRQETVTYQQASYRGPSGQTWGQPAARPGDDAYQRGDRSMGWTDTTRRTTSQSGFERAGAYPQTGRLAAPQYDQQYQYQQMNLPPASPEYFSEFGRPGDQILYVRADGAQTRDQARVQTTAQRTTTTTVQPAASRRIDATSYGDVNYYSEIGYGEFSYYSDFADAPAHPEPNDAANRSSRTTTVRSGGQPNVVTAGSPGAVQYRETQTDVIYHTDDPDVADWLDDNDMNR